MPQTVLDIILNTIKEGTGAEDESSSLNVLAGSLTELQSSYMLVQEVMQAGEQIYDATIAKTQAYDEEVRQMELVTGQGADASARMIQVFGQMGITYDQATLAMKTAVKEGVEPTIAGLEAVAAQYQALGDPVQKDELLLKDFGKTGENMADMMSLDAGNLQKLNDNISAGLIPTQKAVDEAHALTIAQGDLNNAWLAFTNTTTPPFMVALTSIDDALSNIMNAYDKASASGAGYFTILGKTLSEMPGIVATQQATDALKVSQDALTQADVNGGAALSDLDGTQETTTQLEKDAKDAADALAKAQTELGAAETKANDAIDAANQASGKSIADMGTTGTMVTQKKLDEDKLIDEATGTNLYNEDMHHNSPVAIQKDYENGTLAGGTFVEALKAADTQFNNLDPTIQQDNQNLQDMYNQLLALTDANWVLNIAIKTTGTIPKAPVGQTGNDVGASSSAFGTPPEGFIVPAGYPGDSYPVHAQSGEQVIVRTQADQQAGSGSGQIHLHNYGVINITPQTDDIFSEILEAFK